jgi:hypothetical protein
LGYRLNGHTLSAPEVFSEVSKTLLNRRWFGVPRWFGSDPQLAEETYQPPDGGRYS